jgi:hypothetical protein
MCEVAFGQVDRATSIQQCVPEINAMANLISFVAGEFEREGAAMPFV